MSRCRYCHKEFNRLKERIPIDVLDLDITIKELLISHDIEFIDELGDFISEQGVDSKNILIHLRNRIVKYATEENKRLITQVNSLLDMIDCD